MALSEDTCDECAVYFHYERNELGQFVEGGIWYKGFNGPCPCAIDNPTFSCEGSFQCDDPDARLELNGSWAYGSFDNFIFDWRINEGLFSAISAAQMRDCSNPHDQGGISLTSIELGALLYRTGNTVRSAAQGVADDYAIGCDDFPCEDGWTFDPDTDACILIVGTLHPKGTPPVPKHPIPNPCPCIVNVVKV